MSIAHGLDYCSQQNCERANGGSFKLLSFGNLL